MTVPFFHRQLNVHALVLFLLLVSVKPTMLLADDGGTQSWLDVSEQKASLLDDGTLLLEMRAHNRGPAHINALELGVLFAEAQEDIQRVQPEDVYYKPQAYNSLGSSVQRVQIHLTPDSKAALEIRVQRPINAPLPDVFALHVLGFHVTLDKAQYITALANTPRASDERALLMSLGFLADGEALERARQRISDEPNLLAQLRDELLKSIPLRPNEADTLVRVALLLSVALHGGEDAQAALREFGNESNLAAFDEALHVLRLARLTGTPFDAPLAFVLPARAATMKDAVAFAQELAQARELTNWYAENFPQSDSDVLTTDGGSAANTEQDEKKDAGSAFTTALDGEGPASQLWLWGLVVVLFATSVILTLLWLRERKRGS